LDSFVVAAVSIAVVSSSLVVAVVVNVVVAVETVVALFVVALMNIDLYFSFAPHLLNQYYLYH